MWVASWATHRPESWVKGTAVSDCPAPDPRLSPGPVGPHSQLDVLDDPSVTNKWQG